MELMLWFRDHAAPEQVIGASDREMILLIPAIARAYTYIPGPSRSYSNNQIEAARRRELQSLLRDSVPTTLSGRLDYLVLPVDAAEPPGLTARFPGAHLIHSNGKYRLMMLHKG